VAFETWNIKETIDLRPDATDISAEFTFELLSLRTQFKRDLPIKVESED